MDFPQYPHKKALLLLSVPIFSSINAISSLSGFSTGRIPLKAEFRIVVTLPYIVVLAGILNFI